VLFALVVGFVIYYFSQIKEELKLLEKVNPWWLAVAIGSQFLTYLFTAGVYQVLVKAFRAPALPRLASLLKASIVSLFFNQTIPSAGISGNTFLFTFLARFNIAKAQIISLILTELLLFYAAMEALIILLLTACLFVYPSLPAFKGTLAAGIAVYAAFALGIYFAGNKEFLRRQYEKLKKIKVMARLVERLKKKLPIAMIPPGGIAFPAFIRNEKTAALKVFFLQLLITGADVLTLQAIILGVGSTASFLIVLITLVSTRIISILPFLPGSLVLYESSMSFFFVKAGLPLGIAIMITLVYRLLSFWVPIPIGTIFYRRWLKSGSP
jgi:uncharacterized protein (TIRG00374 family)